VIRVRNRSKSGQPAGIVGKIFGSLFCLVFFCAGALFLAFIVRDVGRTLEGHRWPTVECRIVESVVDERHSSPEKPYAFRVRYEYVWQGRTYSSDNPGSQSTRFSTYNAAAGLAERYKPGTQTLCHVNPSAPGEAILQRGSYWIAAAAILPLIFMGIGAGGLYFIWARQQPVNLEPQPISTRAAPARGWLFLFGFFAIFLFVGAVAFYFLAVRTVSRVVAARDWTPTPCVVVSSRVQSHRGDDSTTYSVDILYAYEFNGREFKSSAYGFMGGSSSGQDGKREIVRAHPPGRKTICYVNPSDPTDAVLQRGFTPMMLLGLIPLVFLFAGAAGMRHAWRKRGELAGQTLSSTAMREPQLSAYRRGSAPVSDGPVVLQATKSRVWQLVGGILFAGFWNGIVSVFVWQAVKSFQKGRPEWFLAVFLIPFVAIGLGTLGFVGYSFLRLFTPGVTLRLSRRAIPLGESADLEWELGGRASSIRTWRVWLEGREEATYARGTSTSTDKATFAEIEVASTNATVDIRAGRARIAIPADTMHSFQSHNNKIVWALRIKGEIRNWPDVSEEFPITVLPFTTGFTSPSARDAVPLATERPTLNP